MESPTPPHEPKFDFESDEPKRYASESRSHAAGPELATKKDPIGKRIVVGLVTLATIIGGVAAGVQVYDYVTKRKTVPMASQANKSDGSIGESAKGWSTQSIGSHFHANLPPGWIVADRESFESSISMTSSAPPGAFQLPEYVIDNQFILPGDSSAPSPVVGGQLMLMENRQSTSTDELFNQFEAVRTGPEMGFVDRARTVRIETVSRCETASGEAIRIICSMSSLADPDRVTGVLNLFYCARKDNAWMAIFYSPYGEDVVAANTFLPIVRSVEVYD